MVTRGPYTALLAAFGAQRLWELRKSRCNERRLAARGAREHAAEQLPVMAALHTAWLAGTAFEVWRLAARPGRLAPLAWLGTVAGQALRHAAQRALGERWTVRVWVLPGERPVVRGVYRRLRHPNYLGVAAEIAFLPLVHGAWRSAALFSLLHLPLIAWRIRAEERALRTHTAYDAVMAERRTAGTAWRGWRVTR